MKTQICEIKIGNQILKGEITLPMQPETKLTGVIREMLEQAYMAGYMYGDERDTTEEELLSCDAWVVNRDKTIREIME